MARIYFSSSSRLARFARSTEHDRLDPLEALPVGKALAERTREAVNDRFAVLVAVVARSVGGLDLDGEGGGKVGRVVERLVLRRAKRGAFLMEQGGASEQNECN